jgi:2-polyprenyl-3-methyl-5-hydroxy-6-metoxy-1,4-benzoquinol methylase
MESPSRAENEIAHGKKLSETGADQVWGWVTPAGQVRFHRRADWIIQHAGLKSGVHALEIGCGTGNFTESFASSGAKLLALDISEDLLELARERHLPDTVRFVCQPFETLDMPGTFDAIIGSSVLHHLDITLALAEIFHLLKPGGIIAFAEPNMLNPQILLQKNIPWIKKRVGDSPDETAFFHKQMQSLLQQAGFEIIEVTPLDWLHPAIPAIAIKLFQRIELDLEKIPLVREFAGSLYITARRPFEAEGNH